MTVSNLLVQSAFLMLLGMGVVFAFLGILVTCVMALSRFMQSRATTTAVAAPAVAENVTQLPDAADPLSDPELVSVITSVIHRYRAEKGGKS